MVPDQGRETTPVLIVDDDEAVRRSLQFLLKLEGLDVRLFDSAEALLGETSLPSKGCLVVDQKMPRITGVDLVRRLRRRRVGLPAILITAQLTDDVRAKAAETGFEAVFEKPLEDGGLVLAIQGALGRPPAAVPCP